MTQGVYVRGFRPKTKKALREAIESDPSSVSLEATSIFGNEYGGSILHMPEGKTVYIVGPDPARKRSWYANLTRHGDKFKLQ
jgi:hypothetical protein